MPVFWTSFVPKLEKIWSQATPNELKGIVSSFPYERWEVEQTLFQFRDAAGGLIHFQKKARFRKCSCVDKNGNKMRCIQKKKDWCCERPALLLRKNMILEGAMIEKRRKQNEEKRIDEAVEAAKKIATDYLNSEEGKDEVQSLAEQRVKMIKSEDGINTVGSNKTESMRNEVVHPSKKHMNTIDLMMECFPWKRGIQKDVKTTMCIS